MTSKDRHKAESKQDLTVDDVRRHVREMLNVGRWEIEEEKEGTVFRLRKVKNRQKGEETVSIEEINQFISDTGLELKEEKDGKTTYTLGPERKYVRRTFDEVRASTSVVPEGQSHRFTQFSLKTTPELHEAAKAAAEASGVTFAEWARAAFRKALRDNMDAKHELSEPVRVAIPDSPKADLDE